MTFEIRVDAKLFYKIEFHPYVLQINCKEDTLRGMGKKETNQMKKKKTKIPKNGKLPREKHTSSLFVRVISISKSQRKKEKKDALKTF